MKKLLATYAIILSVVMLGGCAPSVKVPITRPAEINLVGIKRIAMGEISGNEGVALSDLLTQKMFESGRYEVLDRQNMNALMSEHKLNLTGVVDEKTAVRIGGFLGVSAMIFGSSDGQYRQTKKIGDPYKCAKKGGTCREYTRTVEGRIDSTLKVTDLKTGKILAIKNFSERDSNSVQETNSWPPDLDKSAIMRRILDKTANKFVKMIAPYTDYVNVAFEDSKIPEIKSGIAAAQNGLWEEARAQFKKAVDSNPTDAAVWYNLGLAYMYTSAYEEARQAFNKANTLKPSSKYVKEIANCDRLKSEREALNAQMMDTQ